MRIRARDLHRHHRRQKFFYDLKKNKIPDFAEAKTGKGLEECLYEIILGKEGARENLKLHSGVASEIATRKPLRGSYFDFIRSVDDFLGWGF